MAGKKLFSNPEAKSKGDEFVAIEGYENRKAVLPEVLCQLGCHGNDHVHTYPAAVAVTRSRVCAHEKFSEYPNSKCEFWQLAIGESLSGGWFVPEHRLFRRKNNTHKVRNKAKQHTRFVLKRYFRTEKNIGVYKGSACCDKKAIGATFMLFDELSKLGTNCKVRCCTAVTQTTVSDCSILISSLVLYMRNFRWL